MSSLSNVSVKLTWNNSRLSLINQKAVSGLFRMGLDIRNQAQRNAPYKTGALSNSIRAIPNGDIVEVVAGGSVGAKDIRYAAIQEWGGYAGRKHSAHIAGKHYMERAQQYVMSGDYLKKYFGDITR